MSKGNEIEVYDEFCPSDVTEFVPKAVLKNIFIKHPDVEKTEMVVLFRDSLAECKANLETLKVYDFCIIASEDDAEDARKIQNALENQLKLHGCMYDDVCILGKEILENYDEMMERSCKILFLITNNFCQDNFCRRVQNAAVFQCLVDKASKSSLEKCVPVFRHSEILRVKIPLGLRGISGIRYRDISDTNLYKQYFLGAPQTRQKLHMKHFRIYCIDFVQTKVSEFAKEQEEQLQALENAEQRCLALREPPVRQESSNSLIRRDSNSSIISQTVRELKEAVKVLYPAQQSSPAFNGASVSVQGDGNHFGTRNEININITIAKNQNDESESCDEDSD